jgi:hypothetical protein
MTQYGLFKAPALIFPVGEYVKTIPECQSDRIVQSRYPYATQHTQKND